MHGAGGFASLFVPDLRTRSASPNAWLPATELHPAAREPFRAIPSDSNRSLTDLGLWNIFANADFPKPQPRLTQMLCAQLAGTVPDCSAATLLPRTLALFKTPGLRDLGHSGPYMHNGTFDTLEQVIDFYRVNSNLNRAGTLRNGARELSGIALKPGDVAALAAFLKSLNEDYE